MDKRIAIINLGVGNINSVFNSVERLNKKPYLISSGKELTEFHPTHVIMPGVGAVGQAIKYIKEKQFDTALNYLIKEKECFFCGICLGMHILSEKCEEFGNFQGLGWIPGKVTRLNSEGLSLPHMGWNNINLKNKNNKFFKELDGIDMFFAHSYAMDCPKEYIEATSEYGSEFAVIVRLKNIIGIQCHPEKSSLGGKIFLENFINLE